MAENAEDVAARLPADTIIHYKDPDITLLPPSELETSSQDVIFNWAGVRIVRITPETVVKFGFRVSRAEAMNMRFVASSATSIPIPRPFAAYTCRPHVSDPEDPEGLYTYIFMQYIPGLTLDKAWHTYDQQTKIAICEQLDGYLGELQALSPPSYVGSLDEGPVLDNILENTGNRGPFASISDFHHTIAVEFQKKHKGKIASFIEGMLNVKEYKITFAHADLRQANILLRDGKIVGIIDWEMAGWYPEYWDVVKMFYVYRFHDDWGQHLFATARPYFAECAVHNYVSSLLW